MLACVCTGRGSYRRETAATRSCSRRSHQCANRVSEQAAVCERFTVVDQRVVQVAGSEG